MLAAKFFTILCVILISSDAHGKAHSEPVFAHPLPLLFGDCDVKVIDALDGGDTKGKFIVSNQSRAVLSEGWFNTNLWGKAVLYGGLGNRLRIEINGTKKELPIEPVGVIVLGIDGLRQDVLYPDTLDKVQDGGQYRVNIDNLPGMKQVLAGYDRPIEKQPYIMLPEVTAIFPSITFASWASIFTGKLPKETGILGNEFFARDLVNYNPSTQAYSWKSTIPGIEDFPPGVVTVDADGGAFKPKANEFMGGTLFALKHAIPTEIFSTTLTGKLQLSAPGKVLLADPMWSDIGNLVKGQFKTGADVDAKCEMTDYECRTVSIFNHYAKGVDRWGTASISWANVIDLPGGLANNAKLMDEAARNETVGFINNYYLKTNTDRSRKRFPAVFSIYLSGLDHDAHVKGMNGYATYFKEITDIQIKDILNTLKSQGEFDNKIFIVTADHGHTAMPTDLTYKSKWLGIDVDRPAEMSCVLKTDFGDSDNPNTRAQNAERENNNLHIWELGEMMRGLPTGDVTPEGETIYHKVLAPAEIVAANKGETTTTDQKQASVIAALNGPMAHIYVNGANNDWNADPQRELLIKVADLLQAALSEGDGPIPRLASAVEAILIRLTQNSDYVVYNGATFDAAGQITLNTPIPLGTYFSDGQKYINALTRIAGVNHPKRSGDIILIMRDATTGDALGRYTTGVACKSWHGSLNPSDSYVPLIVSYPGGNKFELDPLIQRVCTDNLCEGNWKVKDLISEIIKTQYSGQ